METKTISGNDLIDTLYNAAKWLENNSDLILLAAYLSEGEYGWEIVFRYEVNR